MQINKINMAVMGALPYSPYTELRIVALNSILQIKKEMNVRHNFEYIEGRKIYYVSVDGTTSQPYLRKYYRVGNKSDGKAVLLNAEEARMMVH